MRLVTTHPLDSFVAYSKVIMVCLVDVVEELVGRRVKNCLSRTEQGMCFCTKITFRVPVNAPALCFVTASSGNACFSSTEHF